MNSETASNQNSTPKKAQITSCRKCQKVCSYGQYHGFCITSNNDFFRQDVGNIARLEQYEAQQTQNWVAFEQNLQGFPTIEPQLQTNYALARATIQ